MGIAGARAKAAAAALPPFLASARPRTHDMTPPSDHAGALGPRRGVDAAVPQASSRPSPPSPKPVPRARREALAAAMAAWPRVGSAGSLACVAPLPNTTALPELVARYARRPGAATAPAGVAAGIAAEADAVDALGRLIIATFVNRARVPFARMFGAHLCRVGLPHFVVGALDEDALREGRRAGLPMTPLAGGGAAADYGWGTERFKLMGAAKVSFLQALLGAGAPTVVLADADAPFVSDPLPFFARHLAPAAGRSAACAAPPLPAADAEGAAEGWPLRARAGCGCADLLVATDAVGPGVADWGLEACELTQQTVSNAINIGILVARAPALGSFARSWREAIEAGNARAAAAGGRPVWDQRVFNELLRENVSLAGARADAALWPRRLWRSASARFEPLVFGALPIAAFCDGCSCDVARLPERAAAAARRAGRPAPPPVLGYHTACTFSGVPGKVHRLRERQLWLDDDAYYRAGSAEPAGFLALAPTPPPRALLVPPRADDRLLRPLNRTVPGHMRLAHWQLRRLRSAMLLARALGRRLVLPRFVCALDTWFKPHLGTIPRSRVRLPVRGCPADHVLELGAIPEEWRPRESSFFAHPRFDAGVYARRARLDAANFSSARALLAAAGAHDALVLELREPPDVLALARGAAWAEGPSAGAARRDGDGADALALDDALARLAAAADAFVAGASRWTHAWCCVHVPRDLEPHATVQYDLLFDVPAHVDLAGRAWRRPWEPMLGMLNTSLASLARRADASALAARAAERLQTEHDPTWREGIFAVDVDGDADDELLADIDERVFYN